MSTIMPEGAAGTPSAGEPVSGKKLKKVDAFLAKKIAEQAAAEPAHPSPHKTEVVSPMEGTVAALSKVFENRIHGQSDAITAILSSLTSKLVLQNGTYHIGRENTRLTPEKLKKLVELAVRCKQASPELELEPTQTKITLAGGRKRRGHTLYVTKDPAGKVVKTELVLSRLGQGGFGKVMRVINLETGTISYSKSARTEHSFEKDDTQAGYKQTLEDWENNIIAEQYETLVEQVKKQGRPEKKARKLIEKLYDTREKFLSRASMEVLSTKPVAPTEQAKNEVLHEYNILTALNTPKGGEQVPASIQPMPTHKFMRITNAQADPIIGFAGTTICEGDARLFLHPESSIYETFHNDSDRAKELRINTIGLLFDGMAYAHRQGVYHLDLKSGNVFVGRFDSEGNIDTTNGELRAYLADWGGACQKEHILTAYFYGGTGQLIAYDDFIAYEQAKATSNTQTLEKIFGARDVFAHATNMLMMLSGENKLPYELQANNFPNVKNLDPSKWEPFLLKTFTPEQTKELTKLFKKMLSPNWEGRGTMQEATDAYNRITNRNH